MALGRSVTANFLASGWAALVGLAVIPQYIRLLGIESYGLIGFFVTLQAWLLLLDLSLAATLNREMARFSAGVEAAQRVRNLLRTVESIYALTACAIAGVVAWLAPILAGHWLQPRGLSADAVSHAVFLMGLVVAFQWMATLYRGALLGLQHQVWLSIATAVAATVRAGGTVLVLIYLSPTIAAFLTFQCLVGAAESLTLGCLMRHVLPQAPERPRFGLATLRPIASFAMGLTAAMLLGTLLTQVDKLLLARLLPLDQFGYFSLAVVVGGALAVFITPINNVTYPSLSTLVAAGDEAALAQQYHRFAQLLSMTILPPAMVLCVFSQEIVELWTADAATARAVAPLLSVWVAGTALNGLMHVPLAAQMAHGWTRLPALLNAAAVLVIVPAVLYFVPTQGAIAAAWIWVAINLGYLVFGIAAMHTRILVNEKLAWWGQDVLAPAFTCAAAAVLMWLSYAHLAGTSRLQQAAILIAGTLLMALATASAVPLGRHILCRAASVMLRRTVRLA